MADSHDEPRNRPTPAELLDQGEITLSDMEGPRIDRRTMMKIFGAATVPGAMAMAGCLGDDDDDDDADPDDDDLYGGRLQYAIHREETGELNPGTQPSTQVNMIVENAMNGIMKVDDDLSMKGDIATDWEFEDDGARIVFEIREGVNFHSGNELTAHDIEFTLNKHMDEETTHALDHLNPNIADGGVEAINDYTLGIDLVEPLAGGLVFFDGGSNRAALVLDQEALEEQGEDEYFSAPSGSGAFEIVDHVVDSTITLERFDDYWEADDDGNQLPYLDGIDVQIVPEAAATISGLQTGEIDLVDSVAEEQVDQLAAEPDLVFESTLDLMTRAITFNTHREPFSNRDFRMAVARAIDKDQIVEDVWFGHAEPAHSPYSPVMDWLHREDYDNPQAYDPEWAEQTLEENGWDGTEFTYHGWAGQERLGIMLRQQLAEVGLEMEINTLPTGQMQEERAAGDFDVTPYATVGDLDPDQILKRLYHPDGGAAWHQYESDEMISLIEDQAVELDEDARLDLLHDVADYLNENAVGIYIAHEMDEWARHQRVQGVKHLPSRIWLEETYLDD